MLKILNRGISIPMVIVFILVTMTVVGGTVYWKTAIPKEKTVMPDGSGSIPEPELKSTTEDELLPEKPEPITERSSPEESSGFIAPENLTHIIGKVQYPFDERFSNIYYEGNNMGVRGNVDSTGLYTANGEEVADRWIEFAKGTQGIFLLRDSLWSQQDHVTKQQDPKALILPPSWITAAAVEVANGKTIASVDLPEIEDDAGWLAFAFPQETTLQQKQNIISSLFGPFPVDEAFLDIATRSTDDEDMLEKIRNARTSMHLLNEYIEELRAIQSEGPKAIAECGAEIIARSDREYFGTDIRRSYIIPLLVENPYKYEIVDGKGFTIDGRNIPEDILTLVRTAVLQRRIKDGDIAIERYDLSRPEKHDHVIEILETIIPIGKESIENNRVWVWITGPVNEEGKWQGPDAIEEVKILYKKLASENIDMTRVRFVSKDPLFINPNIEQITDFKAVSKRFKDAGVWLRYNIATQQLKSLIDHL